MSQDETPPSQTSLAGSFPRIRLRRPRQNDWSRRLVRENKLDMDDLIWAIIIREGENLREPIPALPGVFRLSPDQAVDTALKARDLGIPALALFPYTEEKDRDADAHLALDENNLMCRTASLIKDAVPEIGLMGDVALDPYTDHGHDGILQDGKILNDETVAILVRQSITLAKAGFDVIAPSDMMDGRIGAIRDGLEMNGLSDTLIMSYAAKYASAYYGPYREAIGSSGVLQGDKKTYQMDPANSQEAMSEIALDIAEGADMIMVKPGLPYLDIIAKAKTTFGKPTFAFQVSGEYAMIMAAAQNGWIDRDAAILESLMAFKRAGADGIITYFAQEAAHLLHGIDDT